MGNFYLYGMDLMQDWKNRRKSARKQHEKFVKKLTWQRGKQLDQLGDELHEEVFKEVDCMKCANCCKSIPPMLNKTDISRIAKHLSLKPAAFQSQYLRQDEDGDMVMKTTPCPFLQEDNACLIYEQRPRACREYPHTDQLEFSQHLKLHPLNSRYCPAVFHILERMMKSMGH